MQLSRQLAIFALSIVVFLLPFAAAYTAATDVSTVSMTSCSAGSIYAYAENTENTGATLSVSANFGKLYGKVESPIQELPAYQSRDTYITVYSNPCFKGDEDVILYFNICKNTTLDSCTTIRKTVRMMVEPCSACSSYVEQHLPPVDNYVTATNSCVGSGCGQPLVSNIYFEQAYDRSDISIDMGSTESKQSLSAGDSLVIPIIIENNGMSVPLDLSLSGDVSQLDAKLYDTHADLDRGQTKVAMVSVKPALDQSGRFYLTVVASLRGVEVDSKTIDFSVFDVPAATVSAPLSAGSSACGKDATYAISVENTGAFMNTFTLVSGSDAVRIVPSKLTIPAGESETATVTINATRLGFAQDVEVTVTGERTGGMDSKVFRESVVTKILASACTTQDEVVSDNRNFTVSERFYNPSQEIIYGVTGTIEGLPVGFVVEQREGLQDVAPGDSINITLSVSAPSDAQGEVAGVLVLRSQDGTVVKQRAVVLNTVTDGGITGFFIKAGGSNLSYIIALLIGAAIVALLYARQDFRQAAVERVEGARQAIAKATQRPADAKNDAAEKQAAAATGKAAIDAEEGDSATVNNS